MEMKELVKKYEGQVQEWRRYFHQYPELSFKEVETTKRIAKELDEMGITYSIHPDQTGLIGIIEGAHPGGVVALRADIDGLNIKEETNCPFASKNEGVMHACGHDSHIAALLGAARMLLDKKEDIHGTVYLLFQPAEETGCGAPYMMKFGDWYEKIDGIFGTHSWIDVPAGKVSMEPGARMAAADEFYIRVQGKGGHGSMPHQTVDAVVVASAIVMNLQSIVSRNYDPLDSVVVTVGHIESGSRFNIIAEEAVMGGTCRYFSKEVAETIEGHILRVAQHTAEAYGATATLEYKRMVPALYNEESTTAIAQEAIRKVLGEEALCHLEKTPGGEDFAYYLNGGKRGCFAFVGIGNPETEAIYPHHNPKFAMDDRVLSGSSGIYAQFAIDFLKSLEK